MDNGENIACIAFGKNNAETPKLLPDRAFLLNELRRQGIKIVASKGERQAYNLEDGWVKAAELNIDESDKFYMGQPKELELGRIGVVHARCAKLGDLQDILPVVNRANVRKLGSDKLFAYNLLKDGTDLIPTYEFSDNLADRISSERVIQKPLDGTFARGVQLVSKEDIVFQERSIFQPYVDSRIPFPSTIKPIDHNEADRFNSLNTNRPKEVRIYGFLSGDNIEMFPVARAGAEGADFLSEDNWFFIDPDTLDPEIYDSSSNTFKEIAQKTGSVGIYGCIDKVYGSYDQEKPRWHTLELNLRTPYMIGSEHHSGVSKELRKLFARQISSIVKLSHN